MVTLKEKTKTTHLWFWNLWKLENQLVSSSLALAYSWHIWFRIFLLKVPICQKLSFQFWNPELIWEVFLRRCQKSMLGIGYCWFGRLILFCCSWKWWDYPRLLKGWNHRDCFDCFSLDCCYQGRLSCCFDCWGCLLDCCYQGRLSCCFDFVRLVHVLVLVDFFGKQDHNQ